MERPEDEKDEYFRRVIILCQNCSAIYPYNELALQFKDHTGVFPIVPEVTLSDGICPNCGARSVQSKNSLYPFVEDTFAYLKRLGLPELFILRDAILKYNNSDKGRFAESELNKTIQRTAPKLFNFDKFKPQTSSDWAAWLSLITTLIFSTISLIQNGESETKTIILNNSNNTEIFAPQVVVDTANFKNGRNALCPCGSGKKFKKCHGLGK